MLADSLGIPMVSHDVKDHDLLVPKKNPFASQVNPGLFAEMEYLGSYLQHVGRKDYIAVMYCANADESLQRVEAFKDVAHRLNMSNVQVSKKHMLEWSIRCECCLYDVVRVCMMSCVEVLLQSSWLTITIMISIPLLPDHSFTGFWLYFTR